MKKEYFYNLYAKILQELKLQFNCFLIEEVRYRIDENKDGKLFSIDAIYRLKADKKYINLWFGISTWKTKPFDIKIAIKDNCSDYGFPLTDYLSFRPVEFNKGLLFSYLKNYEDAIEISKQLFVELKKLIASEEIQKLLYTDYKVDVPRNWSPYK
jgi:hypothetical protein